MEKIILLATNNENKVKEISSKISKFGIKVISQKEAGFDIEVEENGKTFEENAILKAEAIFKLANKPVVADDSGLQIDALNGEPGVYSHRYAGENATDKDRCNKVLKLMEEIKDNDRAARFVTSVCYIDINGVKHIFNGVCEGKIAMEPHGENGFGYDPVFLVGEKTFAEMTTQEKNEISHRGKAISKLVEYLNDQYIKENK